jgi:FkbM family methyltransferase
MSLRRFTVRDVQIEIDYALLNPQLETLLKKGEYEDAEARAIERLLAPDDVYFEVGAGVGYTACLAWRVLNDEQRIHVYEANPALIPVIEHNWLANGAGGHLNAVLLGTGKGDAPFHVSRAFWASSTQIDYGRGETIQAPRRDFIRQLEKTQATFVLMDIEGGEIELLDKPLPPHVRKLVVEIHPNVVGPEKIVALMGRLAAQGFEAVEAASEGRVLAFVRARAQERALGKAPAVAKDKPWKLRAARHAAGSPHAPAA